jgi:Kef-type K+ transport system membrane component KefB
MTTSFEHQSVESIILQILLMLVFARGFAELAQKLKVPPVLGELVAGIILGGNLLGWVELNQTIYFFAQIGIVLLLFNIGIDCDFAKLIKVSRLSGILACGGLLIPFVLAYLTCTYIFNLPEISALFVAGTLTATSIAITMRVLSQYQFEQSLEARVVLGAAVIDDIVGIMILGSIYHFAHSGEFSVIAILKMLAFILVFLWLTPRLVNISGVLLQKFVAKDPLPGLVPIGMLSLILAFAYLAEYVDIPAIIGGFTAGLALSRHSEQVIHMERHISKKFRSRIKRDLNPLAMIFTPIFFVSVGLSVDFSAIDWGSSFIFWFSLAMTAIAIVGKMLSGILLPLRLKSKVLCGAAMVPRGEVSLIFAQIGMSSGQLSQEVYAGLLAMIIYVMLFSPFWIKFIFQRLKPEQ